MVLIVLCVVLGVLTAHAPGAGKAQRVDVTMKAMEFIPASITIQPGDTIVWQNRDLVPHTVSARDRAWDSGNLLPDSSWRLVVPAADSLPYQCRYHTTMHGVIRVARR